MLLALLITLEDEIARGLNRHFVWVLGELEGDGLLEEILDYGVDGLLSALAVFV